MAYGEKYIINFKNREQINCEIKILEKDYTYPSIELDGAEKPFTLSYQAQDNKIPYGIRGSEAVIEFWASGLTLEDFYSEDDTHWKGEFYVNSVLKWSGFLQLDNCVDILQDTDHILSFNANDGLASLQNLQLLDANGLPINVDWKLTELLAYILPLSGLMIDTNAYLNIYENTTQDRTDFDYLTFLPQTVIHTRYYINDDNTTQTLYDILNNILIDFRSCLFQAEGVWNIVRWGDIHLFDDGLCPGTVYNSDFTTATEIFLPASIGLGRNPPAQHIYDVEPINENQLSRILRPYKYTKETFNYNQPILIDQSDLQLPDGATPFDTNTVGDLRYDDYDLATYFPTWTKINDDGSYLEIVTDISNDPENEIERYIVTPCCTANLSGVRFNPIPVSAGDQMDFSMNWRTDTDTDDLLKVFVRFLLVLPNGNYRGLTQFALDGSLYLHWATEFASADINNDQAGDIHKDNINTDQIDTTQWTGWSLSDFVIEGRSLPVFPQDAMLYVQVMGTNGDLANNTQGIFWNSINLTITNRINSATNIIGQTHTDTQTSEIKNNEEIEVRHDDSPRNAITGTLFTDAITTFVDDIGDIYFTKTSAWHRSDIDEAQRLGELNTKNDLFIQKKPRTIIEGDFFGVSEVSMISILTWTSFPLKNFIIGIASFDYMSCIFNATLYELFETGEEECVTETVTDLDTNGDITTYSSTGTAQAISFSDIVSNPEFTPDIDFIHFVYDGVTGSKNIEVNIEGRWDSTASATLNLYKNASIIGSYFVGTGGAFFFFTANIQVTETLDPGDDIFVALDWVGSAVYELEILDGSFLTVAGDELVCFDDYTFNYLYQN